jgi:hypothetical protein
LDGATLRGVAGVGPGDRFVARLRDGSLAARVEGVQRDENTAEGTP